MIKIYARHPHSATELSRALREHFPLFRVDGPGHGARAFLTAAGPAEIYACADKLGITRADLDLERVGDRDLDGADR